MPSWSVSYSGIFQMKIPYAKATTYPRTWRQPHFMGLQRSIAIICSLFLFLFLFIYWINEQIRSSMLLPYFFLLFLFHFFFGFESFSWLLTWISSWLSLNISSNPRKKLHYRLCSVVNYKKCGYVQGVWPSCKYRFLFDPHQNCFSSIL